MWYYILLFLCVYYIYIRLSRGITRSATCLVGKTALITGANSGLGYQTALNLAARGCKIIMADVADMERSKQNIIEYTGNSNIVTKHVDYTSLQSVRDFASEVAKTVDRIDILVNNAGLGISSQTKTKDGLHLVMQVNYFAHFLLTHLLIDLLKKSAPCRIVWTSSCMAFLSNLSPENLNFSEKFETTIEKLFSYNNSKLAVLIASDIFAEKLKGTGITSNSVHPGFVTTPLFTKAYTVANDFLGFLMRLYNWIYSKDAWEGSQCLVHVAVSKKLENVTGEYFWDCKPFVKPWKAHDGEFCRRIWKESEKLVGLRDDEKL